MRTPTGIPYMMAEAEGVVATHRMDPYHRELMQWLVGQVRAERARAARIAREAVAEELHVKFPREWALAEWIAADIEGDQA